MNSPDRPCKLGAWPQWWMTLSSKEKACFWCPMFLEALQHLARLHRDRFPGPVFGLTGSNGKTTTKELLLAVLSEKFEVHGTKGNLNNHIGVPLTLLSMPKDVPFALVEMGANHQGEIAALSRIANPTHGMITNVGQAHLEGFGGIEGVKKGKQELFVHLAARARHRLCACEGRRFDGPFRPRWTGHAPLWTPENPPFAWRSGSSPQSPLFWSLGWSRTPGPWHKDGRPTAVQLEGAHQLANMTAAIAVGQHTLVCHRNCIAQGLGRQFSPRQPTRGDRHHSASTP